MACFGEERIRRGKKKYLPASLSPPEKPPTKQLIPALMRLDMRWSTAFINTKVGGTLFKDFGKPFHRNNTRVQPL